MERLYQTIAILTAGMSLTMGFLSLVTFYQKGRHKVNLIYGTMCLLIVLFIMLPPVGFILPDSADLSGIQIKRLFEFSFVAIFPWFIMLYTGYKKRLLPSIVTISSGICYLFLFVALADRANTLWVLVSMIILAAMV